MGLVLERARPAVDGGASDPPGRRHVGLLLLIEAAIVLIFNQQQEREVVSFLAHGSVTVGGTIVQWSDIVTFAVAVALTVALSVGIRLPRA